MRVAENVWDEMRRMGMLVEDDAPKPEQGDAQPKPVRLSSTRPAEIDDMSAMTEDPEMAERKRRLRQLHAAGFSQVRAAEQLSLSVPTVKRLSKELGLVWRKGQRNHEG